MDLDLRRIPKVRWNIPKILLDSRTRVNKPLLRKAIITTIIQSYKIHTTKPIVITHHSGSPSRKDSSTLFPSWHYSLKDLWITSSRDILETTSKDTSKQRLLSRET